MKVIIRIAFLVLAYSSVEAQELTVSVFGQSSELGFQRGYSIQYEKEKWGMGVLFQSGKTISLETSNNNHPFIGLTIARELYTAGKMRLLLTPKVGFVNQHFLVFIPELQTEFNLYKGLRLSLGTAIRARQPAATLALSYQILK